MENQVRDQLAGWPTRYYVIKYDSNSKLFVFEKIGYPTDSEFDFSLSAVLNINTL